MYYKFLLILIFSVLLFGDTNETTQKSYAIFEKDKKIVHASHNIAFRGFEGIEQTQLQEAMGVDTPSFIEFWKSDIPKIKDKLLPTLSDSLHAFYESEGYYDANCSVDINNTWVLVNIKENQPVRIKDINISSDYNITQLITLNSGDIFRAKDFINIKNSIVEALLKEGYCSYDLDSKAYVNLDKAEVDLRFILTKGGYCTFGKVTTKGLERIDEDVVISRVRAREGKRFNIEMIQESYKSLYDLDAFDMVSIRYDRKYYNIVPIDIELAEITKKNYFIGGLSYDTNVGAGVRVEYTRKNFLGDAQQLKIASSYSKLEQLLEFRYKVPALFSIANYSIDFSSKIGYSNLEYEGFMEEKGYFQTYLAYTNEKLHIRGGIVLENIDISLRDNVDEGEEVYSINDGTFFLVYPFLHFSYDRRDSKLNPKKGYYLAGMVEYGLDYDTDSSSYLKYSLEGRLIHTLHKLTLSSVLKAGVVDQMANELPESKLFFGGGAYSNRAYGYNQIGVILSPKEYALSGALTMGNLSLEANYPIIGDIYGAVFNDNTMLTDESYDFSGEILSSVGMGVRYITPIGPIKLDVAMNIKEPSQYGIGFQIGQSF